MRVLYLDCSMGAAGDMLAAALFELIDRKESFLEKLNGLSPRVQVKAEPEAKCGILGTHMTVTVGGHEEDCHGHHHHDHHPDHTHHHSSLEAIAEIIRGFPVSQQVKDRAIAVYNLIAQAESAAHGVPVSEVHFHEVGMMDAVVDITAVCMLMEQLGVEKVVSSPVRVGGGTVRCAHGVLPVPAPATASLLCGIPTYSGDILSELCTPTGAALLKSFVSSFGEQPLMTVEKIGYGMGKKDFPQANCLRAMLGEAKDEEDSIILLSCNLDDMTGERIAYATEFLLDAGALDVYTVAVGMKKSRPGVQLSVMCRERDRERLLRLIFKHTTTLGVREEQMKRYTLSRRTVTRSTQYGTVRVKCAEGYGVKREKPEYEDLAKLAKENDVALSVIKFD